MWPARITAVRETSRILAQTSFGEPQGTAKVEDFTAPPCTIILSPASQPISRENSPNSHLEVDYSTKPPTAKGAGGSGWPAVYTLTGSDPPCHASAGPYGAGGTWFLGQGPVVVDKTTG